MEPQRPEDLAVLREQISRIENELMAAKQALARLEKTEADRAAVPLAPPPVLTPPVLASEPPLLVEPPVLPEPLRLAPPPVAASSSAVPPPLPTVNRPWRDRLVQFGLWPPQEEGDVEVRLGAWWATRIGAMLAVLGIVFFAIYISRNTPPVVKLAELVALALLVTAGGLRLERMVPRFGSVVTGAGLALGYFSAVAAYAVPATQVIDGLVPAIAVQLLAVLLMTGLAVWRNAVMTAALAVGFGFVTVMGAIHGGLLQLPLWSVLGLVVVAVGLRWRPGWRSPSVVAVPLAYLALIYHGHALHAEMLPVETWMVWGSTLAVFAVLSGRDLVAMGGPEAGLIRDDVLLQGLNTGLAVAAGWLTTWWLLPDDLKGFYFGAAAVLAALAWGWRQREPASRPLAVVTWSETAVLLALGLVAQFDGPVEWLALLALAGVLLVGARWAGLAGLRVAMYATWVWSLLRFMMAVAPAQTPPLLSVLVFLGLAAAVLGCDERWHQPKREVSYLAGLVLGLAVLRTGSVFPGTGWEPAGFAGTALLLAATGAATRGWRGPVVAAGLALAAAHLTMLGYRPRSHPSWQLWTNGGSLVAVVLALGWWWDRQTTAVTRAGLRWRAGLAIVATLVLQVVFYDGLRHAQDLSCSAAVAVMLMAFAPRARRWPLAIAGTLGLGWGLFLHHPWHARPHYPLLFLAAALAWVLPVWWQLSLSRRESVTGLRWRAVLPWLQVLMATWIMVLAVRSNYTGAQMILVTAAEGLVVMILAWKLGVRPAWAGAAALLLSGAWWSSLAVSQRYPAFVSGDWQGIGAVLALTIVMLALPLRARRDLRVEWRRLAGWGLGGVGLALLFWLFAHQRGTVEAYATVLWGGAAIAVFCVGLFLRERSYRLLGLMGLALCVPRMFLVDLHAVLYRILAFVVLGLVILWVGFSYHRFRHLVAGDDEGQKSPPRLDEKF